MSELRWTLLILGLVFLVALTWWERRRPRQAFAPRLREASLGYGEAQRTASAEPSLAGEPWIGEAGLSDVVSSDLTLTDTAEEPASEGGIHAHGEPSARGPLEELPTLVIPDADECRELEAAWDQHPPEPKLIDAEAAAAIEIATPEQPAARSTLEEEIPGAEGVGRVRIVGEPLDGPEGARSGKDRVAAERSDTTPGPESLPLEIGSGSGTVDANPPVEPIVDWPPEESRRILSLRLVAPQTERFSGRTVRLALAAEGFLLGKFSIFHKPDEANRAVLSVASLTRPGAFDLETMDSQRYGGLSLFAVLPGPKTPAQAFEELLATARNLNERLEGALQDDRGGPLTPLRVTSIRESLRAEAANPPAAASHGA